MPRAERCRLVVLVSGGGSNLQAFIDACASPQYICTITGVISNRPGAGGIARAARAGIATSVVDHTQFASREDFDAALSAAIDAFGADLVILAGFMRILTAGFVQRYRGRLLNIHPSLLPKYPGLHTHQRAIEAGDAEAGASVHFVTEELDGGPVILQARVPVLPDDDADTLAARVLVQEHRIYPLAARLIAGGRIRLRGDTVLLDGESVPSSGIGDPRQ